MLNTTRLVLQLRPYQEFGAKFAVAAGRGLLGDDMGLGKTVQALAAIAHATEADGERHHVVVCPASLIDTWLQEIRRTLTGIKGWRFHGADREHGVPRLAGDGRHPCDQLPAGRAPAGQEPPPIGFAVVDEAHLVKNPEAQRTKIVRSLTEQASRVLLMSGTPLENRAAELIAIADLADPGQGARLRQQFGDGRDAHRDAAAFRDAIGDLYLRRNQDEVLTELPGIIPTDVRIDVGENELPGLQAGPRRPEPQRCAACAHLRRRRAIGKDDPAARRSSPNARTGRRRYWSSASSAASWTSAARSSGKKPWSFTVTCHSVSGRRSQEFQEADGFAALVMQIDIGGVG